ncbi:MAG: hypothetical protein EAZ61_03095 [Oscillatoriales cyanobacterium]|nr:MAG: hypothetical protein EAZ61_03095 [Oscillatoriales cyanobacterium]
MVNCGLKPEKKNNKTKRQKPAGSIRLCHSGKTPTKLRVIQIAFALLCHRQTCQDLRGLKLTV